MRGKAGLGIEARQGLLWHMRRKPAANFLAEFILPLRVFQSHACTPCASPRHRWRGHSKQAARMFASLIISFLRSVRRAFRRTRGAFPRNPFDRKSVVSGTRVLVRVKPWG